ncbi:MAG: membrane protein insertion efficiency factor YidD [Planctomycetota bacterium]
MAACVRFYQRRLSPIVPPRCRFTPTCSEYFIQAVTIKGALRGTVLGLWRLLRCNPWSRGGEDPVR